MNEMIGKNAGAIWSALSENGAMNTKDLKKATKIKLREDKISVTEADKVITLELK